MADRAIRWKRCLHMVGIGGSVVVLLVAVDTRSAGELIVVIDVALSALQSRVRAGQRKSDKVVIESRWNPGRSRMARLAGLGKIESYVIRICRLLKVRQMAANAGRRRSLELSADMALCARQRGVNAGKRESRVLQVIEADAVPVVHVVALLAGSGKGCSNVAGTGRLLVILGVATVTLGGQALVLSSRCTFVARFAVERGMSTNKWETVLMLLYLAEGDIPSLHAVALLATRAKLSLMQIGMTRGASSGCVREYWLGVALAAPYADVHPA